MSQDLLNFNKIRLSVQEIQSIITCFKQCFHATDNLWIFGSRVDLDKRGGDIDLFIESNSFDFDRLYAARIKFWSLLQESLGEQKIDIVIADSTKNLEIYTIARKQGVRLV